LIESFDVSVCPNRDSSGSGDRTLVRVGFCSEHPPDSEHSLNNEYSPESEQSPPSDHSLNSEYSPENEQSPPSEDSLNTEHSPQSEQSSLW
jgi:hypothetical protein